MTWAARTDVGKRRKLNEDSLVAEPGLFAVADGMGGHLAGDVASQLVTERLQRLTGRVPLQFDDVAELVEHANREVRERARADGTDGMGTTLVAAVLVDNGGVPAIVVINVGDSRCYLLDEAGLRMVTHDHSLVQELIDAGDLAPERAARHPERNVVTRAIGADDSVVPDFVVLEPTGWQRLLLCSDGVSGQISTAELGASLRRTNSPEEALTEIMNVVLAGRAPDNATAIVVDVERTDLDDDADITGPRRTACDGDDADITGQPRTPLAETVDQEPPASAAPDSDDATSRQGRFADASGPYCEPADPDAEAERRQPIINAVPKPEAGSTAPAEKHAGSPIAEVPR